MTNVNTATLPTLIALLLITALAGTPAGAHQSKSKTLVIGHPWVNVTADHKQPAHVRLIVTNTGKSDDTLLGATSPRARSVEVSTIESVSGGKEGSPKPIPIRRGQRIVVDGKPYAIVMKELISPLEAYDRFPMTLRFAKAGHITIEVSVDE